MEKSFNYQVRVATALDLKYAESVAIALAMSAKKRGTGIVPRPVELIKKKIIEGLAAISIDSDTGEWTGFCYIDVWKHGKFIANSGLIVQPEYRSTGIAKELKSILLKESLLRFPESKLLSITASPAVQHINIEMGYRMVPFDELVKDPYFINGSDSWVDFADLIHKTSNDKVYRAMVLDLSVLHWDQGKKELVALSVAG